MIRRFTPQREREGRRQRLSRFEYPLRHTIGYYAGLSSVGRPVVYVRYASAGIGRPDRLATRIASLAMAFTAT
jgi:hypothetical protein